MARLIEPKLEIRAIFTILDARQEKYRLRLLSLCKEEHFGYEPVSEILRHVKKSAGKHGKGGFQLPSSKALKHSPGLSDAAKNILSDKKSPLQSTSDIDKLYEDLEFYRKLRSVYNNNKEILKDLAKDPASIEMSKVKEKVENLVSELQDPGESRKIVTIGSAEADEVYKNIFKKRNLYATGFKNFDSIAGGYQRGDMVMLAGSTGGGKSILAMNMAMNFYRKYEEDVAIISLELTEEQYLARMMSYDTGIDYGKFRKNELSYDERKKADKAWHKFKKFGRKNHCRFEIIHPGPITATDLFLLLKPRKPRLVIIDNVVDLEHIGAEADWAKLGRTAVVVKDRSQDLGCLTLCCTHVTEDNRIAYSKILKEKADGVWMWTYGEEEKTAGQVKINQLKARHFEPFSFYLTPEFKTQCFLDSAGPPALKEGEDKELERAMKEIPN